MADSSITSNLATTLPSYVDKSSKTSNEIDCNQSPWKKNVAENCVSFVDVMSEQLVSQITAEDGENKNASEPVISEELLRQENITDETDSDLLLAHFLQRQYDEEHDNILKKEEQLFNGSSKVRISFDKHLTLSLEDREDKIQEEIWEDDGKDEAEIQFKKNGTAGKGKNIITKHDANVCGKKNVKKMENFCPTVETGNTLGSDILIPNHVYNHLKKHNMAEVKLQHRLHEKKEHSTREKAVDEKTRLLMYKLVNNGTLNNINGVISTGKESVVFHADGGVVEENLIFPECAIKVFKTTLTGFKNRAIYMKGDTRFFKDEFKHQNPRKIMRLWAEKEEFNLKRMARYNIPCPKVVCLKKHVLVMEFLGRSRKPAPKLKDVELNSTDWQIAYEQVTSNMRRLYQECGLVHADLSEYNVLWHDSQVYFIDVGQAVEKMHPKALQFLLRDCSNMVEFFKKKGVMSTINEYELFNKITDLDFKGSGKDFLLQINDFEKNEEKIRNQTGKEFSFDYFFENAPSYKAAPCDSDSDEMIDNL